MYVVNQNLQRALATSQAEIVVSLASTTGRVLGSDFIGMVQRKMRDECYPKAAIQGALPPEDKVVAFLVLLNNLDVALDYIKRIVRAHADVEHATPTQSTHNLHSTRVEHEQQKPNAQLTELFPMGRDATAVHKALRALETGFTSKAGELNSDGMAVLFAQVVKPRMRPLLAEVFRDAEYTSSSDGADGTYPDAEAVDLDIETSSVRSRLSMGWEALTRPLKRILSERNYDRLLTAIANYLSSVLEKRLWSYHGRVTELGAVALERDVVDMVNVVVKGESFGLREAYSRCLQIVTVMNLEEDEWEGVVRGEDEGEEGVGWVLDERERVRAKGLVKGRV